MLTSRRIVLFLISCILITVSFYNDRLGLIEDKFYTYYQQSFEFMVVGRLVKSLHDGPFSAGGLLAAVDADTYDITSRSIKHQYDLYTNGNPFGRYWTYKSTPAMEGIVYSLIDQFTNFSPGLNLRLFRASAAFFTAVVLSLLLIWLDFEFGILAFALALISIVLSPWLVLLGANMYWQLWSLFLPFVSVLLLLAFFSSRAKYSSIGILITVFIVVLLKVLFTGFEFIATALVSCTIPFVYFAIRDQWGIWSFIRREISVSVSAILATAAGLVILLLQIQSELGNLSASTQYILAALGRRTTGDPAEFSGVFAAAMDASIGSVIRTYMKGPAYTLPNAFTGGDSKGLPYFVLVLIFFIASLVAAWLMRKSNDPAYKRKCLAFLGLTWFSSLAPLSWFVVFKAHAYIHLNLDYFVWQAPFTILGFALTGWTIAQSYHYIRTTRARG